METINCKSYEELSVKSAELIFKNIKTVISQKGKAVLALPGGRSIVGVLKELKNKKVDWSKVEIFLTDERVVPIEDKESNYKLIMENLNSKIGPKIHPFDLNKRIKDYNQQFQQAGGHFDLIVLGVGEDGHIASLFPHHPVLEVKEKKYLEINNASKPPLRRITASPEIIKDANVVILLFVSKEKKKAYQNFRNTKIFLKECPAKIALETQEMYAMKDF